jgi:transposase-like protein
MNLEKMVSSPAQEVEVLAKPQRRKFSVDYKLKILQEANRCKQPGEVGALLRREGLYWSSVSRWRKAWENGELSRAGAKKRGPVPRPVDERDRQIAELEREVKRFRARAERAEALVEVQKKVSELLGVELPETDKGSEKN